MSPPVLLFSIAGVLLLVVQSVRGGGGGSMLHVPCGSVLQSSDALFANESRVDNARQQRVPHLLVAAACEGDVVAAVLYAQTHGLALSALAGGHSAEGFGVSANGALVVNVRQLQAFSIDAATLVATVGAGFRFSELYALLNATDPTLLMTGGGCPDVGLAGFMLGGGLSFLSRPLGAVGSDTVLSMRVVLANGTATTVTRQSDPVLFRALGAGGGGNFGIVVEFRLQLFKRFSAVQNLCFLNALGNSSALAPLIPLYAQWLADDATPSDFGAPALLSVQGGDLVFCVTVMGVSARSWRHAADVASLAVDDFFSLASQRADGAWTSITLDNSNRTFYGFEFDLTTTALNGRFGLMTSFVFDDGDMDDGKFAALLASAVANAPPGGTLANFHDMGGRVRDVARSSSWFPHRDAVLVMQLKTLWPHVSQQDDARHEQWAVKTTLHLRGAMRTPAAYVNYIESARSLPDWQLAYFAEQWPLLLRAKLRYDPAGLFRFPQSIGVPPSGCSMARAYMVNLAMAFQFAQTSMDANAAASLFAADGSTVIPVGHGNATRTTGPAAIAPLFGNYFRTLRQLNETITTPVVVSGTIVAFGKRIDATLLDGTVASKFVVNWFNLSCNGNTGLLEIQEFDGAFNS
jgi:FAD/FMN-containing dehydrogenase